MSTANINRYIRYLLDAFVTLNTNVPMRDVERMAMIAHSAMENKRRVYHTSQHVFDMCEGMNARQVLACIFHDVVYYQIDGGYPQQSQEMLSPILSIGAGSISLNKIDPDNLPLNLCASIFNFSEGQSLNVFGGLNEFLSAIVATNLLVPFLTTKDLLAVITNIEATIPFRKADAQGVCFAARLAKRVKKTCEGLEAFNDQPSIETFLNEVMIDSIDLANKDVGGFAEKNPAKFLSSTWQLIEESNAPLNSVSFYTIQDYRGSLIRMDKFLSSLSADQIFHQYANTPAQDKLASLYLTAKKNIAFSCQYLGAKITSIAIIEALALETGGNCPVSMLLGDIHCDNGNPDRAENFLPRVDVHPNLNTELLDVLEGGRAEETKHDLTSSPLTAFVYRSLGDQGVTEALLNANKMFNQERSRMEFLMALNQTMLLSIISACGHIAISRSAEFQKVYNKIASNQ